MEINNISNQSEYISEKNKHIEQYLDYFSSQEKSTGFAVLIKGEWGSGKSWFINQYINKLKSNSSNKQNLYINLYGINNISQIDDLIFEAVHPILSSKTAKIARKIVRGVLSKWVINIDWNQDSKLDGNVQPSLEKINTKDFFNQSLEEDSKYNLIIFDDLERCKIPIEELFGYINNFVSSEYLKVVIILNENKIEENNYDTYKNTKEKIIGQTLEMISDIDSALNFFIEELIQEEVKVYLKKNINTIEDIYIESDSHNLRILKQIILNFKRVFEKLPEEAQKSSEFIHQILKVIIIFSLEINYGRLKTKNICLVPDAIYETIAKDYHNRKNDNNIKTNMNNIIDEKSIRLFLSFFNLEIPNSGNEYLQNIIWWQKFFHKGLIDEEGLEILWNNSKYNNQHIPEWIKLYHWNNLEDEDFTDSFKSVIENLKKKHYKDLGVIKHIIGIFLCLSENGFCKISKKNIINYGKKYLDHLYKNNLLDANFTDQLQIYNNLWYQSHDSQEFKEFSKYVNKSINSAKKQNLPDEANNLLKLMEENFCAYIQAICSKNITNNDHKNYLDIPIFEYIKPQEYFDIFIKKTNIDKQRCLWSLKDRYKSYNTESNLSSELDFIKDLKIIIDGYVIKNPKKISSFILKYKSEKELKEIIDKLEQNI